MKTSNALTELDNSFKYLFTSINLFEETFNVVVPFKNYIQNTPTVLLSFYKEEEVTPILEEQLSEIYTVNVETGSTYSNHLYKTLKDSTAYLLNSFKNYIEDKNMKENGGSQLLPEDRLENSRAWGTESVLLTQEHSMLEAN